MSPRPRVCLLTETFQPEIGGGETQGRLLAEALAELGFEVVVITRRSLAGLPRLDSLDGTPIHRVGPTGRGRLKKWGLLLTAPPALARLRGRYDVLLVSGFRILGVPAVLAALAFRKGCVLKADSNGEMSGEFFAAGLARARLGPSSLPIRGLLGLRNSILRRADAFVALSSRIAGELAEHRVPADRVHRIPNCVDTDRFRPPAEGEKERIRRGLGIPADAAVFTYTGRLVSYKGLPLLLRVWKEICAAHPRAHLLLVGEGGADMHDCEPELRRYASANGLEDRITFTGAVEDVPHYLKASDAFVFPTEDEAFGIALVEAMACGLPAITTSVGGVADIAAQGENALVVEPGDPSALRRAIESLLVDPGLAARLGAQALRTARERYARDAVAERYADLLRRSARAARGAGR